MKKFILWAIASTCGGLSYDCFIDGLKGISILISIIGSILFFALYDFWKEPKNG